MNSGEDEEEEKRREEREEGDQGERENGDKRVTSNKEEDEVSDVESGQSGTKHEGTNGNNNRRRKSPKEREEDEDEGEEQEEGGGTTTMEQDEQQEGNRQVEETGLRRRKIRRRVPSTSSSSSSSSSPAPSAARSSSSSDSDSIPSPFSNQEQEENGNGQREQRDEDEQERPQVLDKEKTKCAYRALRDMRRRETGQTFGRHEFSRNRIGSVCTVGRFELAYKLFGHDGCVNSLHFNESGNLLASGSDDLDIIVWDWEKKRKRYSFSSGHNANIFQSKFLPFRGDTHIVSTSRDGQVRLAELSSTGSCRSTKRLALHRGPANKLSLLPESPHSFLTGGEDGVVYCIDVRESKPTKLLVQRKDDGSGGRDERKVPICSVDVNPKDDYVFCTAGRDQYLRIYDRRFLSRSSPLPAKKFCPHHLIDSDTKANITCAVFSHDGREVIGSYNDDDIYLFKSEHSDGADYSKRYQGHRNSMTDKGVNFYGPRSEFVVSGSDCGHIFLWGKNSESIVNMMEADDKGAINVLEPHPNLPVMATSGLDDEVKIWFPTSNSVPNNDEIEKTVIKNCTDRAYQRMSDPMMESIDGQMLWVLWRQIRRSDERRRRAAAAAAAAASGDPISDDSLSSSEDEDSDGPGASGGGLQCQTS